MLEADPSPRTWRVIIAFVAAPTSAAFVAACFAPAYMGLPDLGERILRTAVAFCLLGAYPPALLLGVPAYFAMRGRARPTALNCALVGAAVAALPWLALGLLAAPDYSVIDGRATFVDGQRTAWGWISFGTLIGQIAAAGALGGAVFWAVAAARLRKKSTSSA